MPIKCPPPSWVSAPVSALSPGPHSGDSPGSDTGPRVGFRGTDIFPKRSVFKEAPACPLHLSPAQGTGTWEGPGPGSAAPPGAPGRSSFYTCSSHTVRTRECQEMPDP